MAVGLSTYAFFWQALRCRAAAADGHRNAGADARSGRRASSRSATTPRSTRPRTRTGRRTLRRAGQRAIALELGTRGVEPAHLLTLPRAGQPTRRHLVRSMLNTATHRPTRHEAVTLLKEVIPAFAEGRCHRSAWKPTSRSRPTIWSTWSKRSTARTWVSASTPPTASPRLELPGDVIDRVAPYVVNMHVKDFTFSRQDGWVGFYADRVPPRRGTSRLRRHDRAGATRPEEGISQVIEHWLPWQGTTRPPATSNSNGRVTTSNT